MTGPGYQTGYTGDIFLWQVSFPTRASVQMCTSRPFASPGTWGDNNLRIAYSIVTTTTCVAGEYMDPNYVCRKCPAGTFGATTPLVGAQCSGPCAAGTYSTLGSTACSATVACPIGQYKNQFGACATCSGATPVVAKTGTACAASCPVGTLNVNGLCTPSAVDSTYTNEFAVGSNNDLGVMRCCPVTMTALSPTAAFKSVSFEVQNGVNTYTAAAGQCHGCAAQSMTSVQTGAVT